MKALRHEIEKDLLKTIEKLETKVESFTKLSKKYSIARLAVFIITTISFLGFYLNGLKMTAVIIAIPLSVVFILLMINHNKVEKSIKKFRLFIQIKKEEVARLKLDWDEIPFANISVRDLSFIEQDFNIAEQKGLLHLIFNGRTAGGLDILREWLSGKSNNFDIIRERQNIVKELRKLTHFRTRLLLATRLSISENLNEIELSEWIKSVKKKKGLKLYTLFLSILCIVNLVFLIGNFFGLFQVYYYQALLIYIFFYFSGFKFIKDLQSVSEFLYEEVRKFSSVFKFIEYFNYGNNKYVKQSLSSFLSRGISPTKTMNKINFTVEILNLRKNPFVWFMIICILPVDFVLSQRVEKFRESIKNRFPKWLFEWYRLEANASLAEFAYLNPEYTFPEFEETAALIDAKNLGHPLIDPAKKIENDFRLNESTITNIITGSNMSGKSTFLRTVGINMLLAYSGSVVNAEIYKISKFNLYSCIKVSDSVVDGISYFYAEVKRLKYIIDEIKKENLPSIVLIDEIYKGTNNIERLVGSRALVKYLGENNIFNIISTHDLELVKIVEEIDRAKNYHFRELIENNKMTFDFKLMEGPSPSTNALKIISLEGLPT